MMAAVISNWETKVHFLEQCRSNRALRETKIPFSNLIFGKAHHVPLDLLEIKASQLTLLSSFGKVARYLHATEAEEKV